MKLDPRKLRPAELARLLNSTPLGEVVKSHVVYRHQNLAGYRIGDGRRIDLVRYVAWLAVARHIPRPAGPAGMPSTYEAMKAAAAARNRRLSAEGRDIGNVIVQRKTAAGMEDVVHDISFAFAFHAFKPNGTLHVE